MSETELRSCCKVGSCNWMKGIRQPMEKPFDCVEVRFKNNRKEFYRLPDGIDVSDGDIVAVEGIPGHDVGIVSLTGEVCRIQMLKKKVDPESDTIKKLFRRAKVSDIERWTSAIREEENTLKKTRQIAEDLGLVMKVNDVEYQGDHSKAIFYYTADDRVDFRNLIKVLAEQFHVRIEMKQIGVRQEAGKVGGIGTCGRELCCSTWLTNFKSVTTSVAKTQQILPNRRSWPASAESLNAVSTSSMRSMSTLSRSFRRPILRYASRRVWLCTRRPMSSAALCGMPTRARATSMPSPPRT